MSPRVIAEQRREVLVDDHDLRVGVLDELARPRFYPLIKAPLFVHWVDHRQTV